MRSRRGVAQSFWDLRACAALSDALQSYYTASQVRVRPMYVSTATDLIDSGDFFCELFFSLAMQQLEVALSAPSHVCI
jgi:hypothetical protein